MSMLDVKAMVLRCYRRTNLVFIFPVFISVLGNEEYWCWELSMNRVCWYLSFYYCVVGSCLFFSFADLNLFILCILLAVVGYPLSSILKGWSLLSIAFCLDEFLDKYCLNLFFNHNTVLLIVLLYIVVLTSICGHWEYVEYLSRPCELFRSLLKFQGFFWQFCLWLLYL